MLVRAAGLRCAADGIPRIDLDDMFVDVMLMHMVKVAVVKIVDMAIMAYRGMSAVRAVLMGMVGMMLFGTSGHDFLLNDPTGLVQYPRFGSSVRLIRS